MPCTLSSRKIYYGGRYKLVLQYRILTSFWSNMLSVFAPTPKSIIYKFYSLWFYPLLTYPFAKYFCSEITPKFLLCDHEKYCHVHHDSIAKTKCVSSCTHFGNTFVFGLLLSSPHEKCASTFLTTAVVVIY